MSQAEQIAKATQQIAKWELASEALANGKDYTMGERRLTKANANEVERMLAHWRERLRLASGGSLLTRRQVN